MSAAPGDRPRDDSFEDKGSPAQDAKDSEVKHVVSLRRQIRRRDPRRPARPVDDEATRGRGPRRRIRRPPTPAATRRWRKAKHAASLLNPGEAPQKEAS